MARISHFAVLFTGFSCARWQDVRPAHVVWRRWFADRVMLNPRRENRPSIFARFEALETRCLLSAALPDAAPSDVAAKIDPRFYTSFVNVSRGAADDWVRSRKVRADSSKRVDAYVYTGGDPTKSVDGLRKLGAQIAGVSPFG